MTIIVGGSRQARIRARPGLAMLLTGLALLFAGAAEAGDAILRGPPPSWVRPAPAAQTVRDADGQAFRIERLDHQHLFEAGGWTSYVRTRTALLSPEALAGLGNVTVAWNPSFQDITIHGVEIIRGDQRIDALGERTFEVLRREPNLEAATVDGVLTGALQLEGLRVGDRIEVAYTTVMRMPVLQGRADFFTSVHLPVEIGDYSLRVSWPVGTPMRVRATDDWPTPTPRRQGDQMAFEMALSDLEPLEVPQNAPLRFHHVRAVEASDFDSWGEVAALFAPLYARAAALGPDSPVRAEAERIRAAGGGLEAQALAALRLVQDEVRYLALAMGDGGLVPATADETWARRLGDCKGKTTLLLALLHELGIEARPVFVSSFDDALDRRLPRVSAFDHVIVRAEIEGRTVWLDGARTGDRTLEPLQPVTYGWVLPIAAEGAEMVRIEAPPPAAPLRETRLEIDLTAGLYAPAPVTGEIVARADGATGLRSLFAVATASQRDAYLRALWNGLVDDLDITEVGSRYDAEAHEIYMTMAGRARLDWTAGVRVAEIPLSRLSWSAGEPRDAGPFQSASWTTNFPLFSRFRTLVTLPNGGEGFEIRGEAVDMEAAAYRHRREVRRDGARVIMERETLALRPEMTEAERAAAVEPLRRLERNRAGIVARDYRPTFEDEDAWSEQPPQTADELVQRGLNLQNNGRLDEAIEAYDAAIALEPDNANAWANRGVARFWQGRLQEATADLDRATELDPSEGVAINGRSLIAISESRYLDAVVETSLGLRSNPDDAFLLGLRSRAYWGLGEWDRALEDVARREVLDPGGVGAPLTRARILLAAGRDEEAARVAEALTGNGVDSFEVLLARVDILKRAGRAEAALALIEPAVTQEPDHPRLLLARAEARLLLNDLEAARADLRAVRAAARESGGLLNNLCWVQALAGVDLDLALADCEAAVARFPDTPAFQDSRAFVLLRLGRLEEARAAYDRVLEQAPRNPSSLYGRGLVKRAQGQDADAAADIEAARRLEPDVAWPFRRYEASLRPLP